MRFVREVGEGERGREGVSEWVGRVSGRIFGVVLYVFGGWGGRVWVGRK